MVFNSLDFFFFFLFMRMLDLKMRHFLLLNKLPIVVLMCFSIKSREINMDTLFFDIIVILGLPRV